MDPIPAYQFSLAYPGAFFPSRLEWLCQPEQIEYTLRLLYYLNSWKKANQQLLYADRQGLQEVQTMILARACKMGVIRAVAYLDGSARFPGELLLESVASNAARGVLIHVRDICDPDVWPPFGPDGTETYQRFIRPLYRRINGQDYKIAANALGSVCFEELRSYIEEKLQQLVTRAQVTRAPISTRRLACLCITPADLLHIRDNRPYVLDDYRSWDELDSSELRKLDPEGYSEIALRYISPTAEYVFHLPFNQAINFVPVERIRRLKSVPGNSQELGSVQGQPIDEVEALAHPSREILQDLGVDIPSVCPYELQDKQLYLAKPAIRDLLWPTRVYEYEDWDENPDFTE